MPQNRTVTERSVSNLQTLITVVISLALIQAIESVVSFQGDPVSLSINIKLLVTTFLVLIVTLIPFHHGANRYLDETYIDKKRARRPMTGLVDFFFFFVEAGIFYGMALSISEPRFFFFLLVILLGIDVAWLLFVLVNDYETFKKIKHWLWLNLIMIILVLVFRAGTFMPDAFDKWFVLGIIAIIRTGLDYKLEWPFYWPAFDSSQAKPTNTEV